MSASHGKKPVPLFGHPVAGTICPHCGKRSYSISGEHPQCSQTYASKQGVAVKKK